MFRFVFGWFAMAMIVGLLLVAWNDHALAESSHTEGPGSLTATARIDIRIVIPPTVTREPDGSLTNNFGTRSGWQHDEDTHGVVTLSNP